MSRVVICMVVLTAVSLGCARDLSGLLLAPPSPPASQPRDLDATVRPQARDAQARMTPDMPPPEGERPGSGVWITEPLGTSRAATTRFLDGGLTRVDDAGRSYRWIRAPAAE